MTVRALYAGIMPAVVVVTDPAPLDCSPFGRARREGWANYSADLQVGEEWVRVFDRLPSCWSYVDREGGWLLVVPWLADVVEAWGRDTMAIADTDAIVQAVKRHGAPAASMLLVKLAARFDERGEV